MNLEPLGVIPRDPRLVLRMQVVPPPTEATAAEGPVVLPFDPCGGTGGTLALFETFTGTSDLVSHTSDSGASWTQTSGNTAADTYVVDATVLRRADFSEVGGDSFGEAWAVPSQQPTTSKFYIDVDVLFKGELTGPDPIYSVVSLYQQADAPGNEDFLCSISSQGLGTDAGLVAGPDTTAYTTTPNVQYTMRLFVDGVNLTLCINGVKVAESTVATPPTGPFGIDTFNFNGVDNFEIDGIRIADVT